MKKISLILIFIITFITSIQDYNAACTYTRISNLKKIAANVDITYTYKISDNKATFDITVANMTNDIYLYDSFSDKKYIKTGEFVINDFNDGTKYRFFIKSNDKNCKDEVLLTKYITLPKYNPYYGDPICKGIESYELCQRWGAFNIGSYKEYKSKIEKYKASIAKNEVVQEKKKEMNIKEVILNFLLEYYVYILLGVIAICLILIYYLKKKDSFNF